VDFEAVENFFVLIGGFQSLCRPVETNIQKQEVLYRTITLIWEGGVSY